MVVVSADLRQPLAPRLRQGLRLSEDDAAGGAPRRLAAERRPAGERPRFRAAQQHLDFYGIEHRDHESAVADRAGRPERRAFDRAGVRRQRRAARALERPGSAAEVVRRGALRGRRCLGRRSPQARRQQAVRAGVPAQPHRRGGRPQALLADLRGRGRGRTAGRHPRLRLQRLADDELGLSVVLHRGDDRARHRGAGHGHRASSWKACSSAARS